MLEKTIGNESVALLAARVAGVPCSALESWHLLVGAYPQREMVGVAGQGAFHLEQTHKKAVYAGTLTANTASSFLFGATTKVFDACECSRMPFQERAHFVIRDVQFLSSVLKLRGRLGIRFSLGVFRKLVSSCHTIFDGPTHSQ
jgi:hypothetical protein